MASKIYALLVGIDNYSPESRGVNSLKGSVNDIKAIEAYLRKQIATDDKWELVEKILTNDLATRQGVIDGFLKHLCQADSEDVVLFYYSGHGSYETVPEVFRNQERDDKIGTIVCYDSRTSEGLDLAAQELSYLIEQVAKNNPHILIILDCCHSGTAIRDPEAVERQIYSDRKVRDLKDFLFPKEWLDYRLSNSYQPPRHIALAACRNIQTTKEYKASDGQTRGAFSYFLTEALQRTNGSLSYANLFQDINALITGKVKNQSPQIEATSDDLIKTFLLGAAGEHINYFSLSYDNNTHCNWVINGGILHGIHPKSEGDTFLAIFPQGTQAEKLQEIGNAICEATLTQVFTEVSIAEIIGDISQLSKDEPYWAIVTSVPLPKLKVYFQGNVIGVEVARTTLSTVDGSTSLFVRETESLTDADYYLEAINGQYWIKQPADKQPLVAPVPEVADRQGYTQQRANQIIKRLEHIARWRNILELKTPPTSQIKAGDVEMEVTVTSGGKEYSSKTEASALRGEYTWKEKNSEPPEVKITVSNKSDKELYFQVIELAGSYAIYVPEFFPERSSISLPSQNVASGEELVVEIPRTYLNNGITEYDTILKLIVSTREFNASLLQQPELDSPPPVNRSSDLSGTLNRLMDKVYTRETTRKKDKYIDNWMTQEVKITLVKPPGGVEIQDSGSTTLLTGVELQGHQTFKGKFSLNSLPPSSRHVNSNLIPPIFLQDQTIQRDGDKRLVEPYQFNMTRSSGLFSVLEIVDVQNHESVTPENPIKLLVGQSLSSDEHILPVAYDGEFFLPLGKAKNVNGKTEITIERLPEPTVNSRSLQGSIKILFQKVLYNTLGKDFEYPLLRIAKVSSEGDVFYLDEDIKAKVASASKILLYIHGIIGDTRSLLPSVLAKTIENGQEKIQDKYDLILAFDYENLNTTIQENAKLLKQKLEEVGLTANHGKQLHIVAHSMGGLVARTFIEKEDGNQIVQHLVMLGTPNAGSPWATIQDWAFTALGIGLNQLSSVAWPLNIITALLSFLEANDNALDQMKPQSEFIQSIAKNIDPQVQYTIIAGDRSIRSSALEIEPGKNSSQIQRLMQKLFGSAVDNVVDTVFLQQPNDIAVTLSSIKSISLERNPQPIIISPDSACDHLTYFTSQAGLDALANALKQNYEPDHSAETVKTRLWYFGVKLPTKNQAVGEDLILNLNFTSDSQLDRSIRVPFNTLEVTIYIEASGFYLQGEHTRTLPVRDGELMERSLTLNLTPLVSGDCTINLSVYPGGRLPNLSPEKLPIEVRVNTPIVLPNIPELIDRRAIPEPEPDVILHVTIEEVLKEEQLTGLQRVGLYLTCGALSCDRQPLEPLHFTANELEKLRQSAIQAAAVANGSPVDVLISLQAIGATLFDRLMPLEHPLRNYYWELFKLANSNTPLTWLIVSEAKAVLPWELVCAYDYNQETGKNWYDEFLAQKFILAHWVGYQGLKLANEAPLLELGLTHYNQRPEHLSRWQKVLGSQAQAKSNQQSGLLDLMQPSSSCYGLHILRYTDPHQIGQITSYEANPELASGKTLNQAEELLYNQRLDFTLRRPVVGLSLVDGQTANRGMAMSGSDNQLEADWMLPLMHAGASVLVGSRWSVLPESDRLFYRTFYNLMRSGIELGSAVWQARKDVRLAFPHRSDWLAYTYFGHPQCQPYLVRPSQGFTFFEAINPPENDKFLAGKSYRFRASYRTEAPVWYSGRLSLQEISKEAEDLSVMMVRLTGEMPPEFYQLKPVASKESYQDIITIIMPSKEMILPLLIRFQKGSDELNTLFLNLNVVDRGQS